MKSRKIGILGGTFDPIHIGHLLLAQWAMDAEGLDQVWLLPTGCSYMKSTQRIVPAADRYEMVCRAIEGNPGLKCLDLEIRRTGPSYTCDTLEDLRRMYPQDHFYFICGADCLFAIQEWKEPRRIMESCTIVAALRNEASLEEMELRRRELAESYGADIRLLSFPQIAISSTAVRNRIRAGLSARYLVPDGVLAYIEEKGFYRYENS